MKHPFVAILIAFASVTGNAKIRPVPSNSDGHFQRAPYVHDVIEIVVRPGRFAEIVLSSEEDDIQFAIGDRKAWTIKTSGNIFGFKPNAAIADTNLKIWSEKKKRVYWFNIVMAKKNDVELWHLDFDYPPEPIASPAPPSPEVIAIRRAVQERARINQEHEDIERSLGSGEAIVAAEEEMEDHAPARRILNGNYGVIGPEELTPTSVYDNGEQTVLTFAPNNPLPAIFVKEADGSETRVPKHVENDMLIVHRVARQFVLRHLGKALCLINGSFVAAGPNNETKTVSQDVVRELVKGR